mmetsp:Transcript_1157/g.3552  ORF Transcript_1157/g.3552 Transcript_1157/m.3552 type:complete len:369 (-) Transcript_1157:104-1210(-)
MQLHAPPDASPLARHSLHPQRAHRVGAAPHATLSTIYPVTQQAHAGCRHGATAHLGRPPLGPPSILSSSPQRANHQHRRVLRVLVNGQTSSTAWLSGHLESAPGSSGQLRLLKSSFLSLHGAGTSWRGDGSSEASPSLSLSGSGVAPLFSGSGSEPDSSLTAAWTAHSNACASESRRVRRGVDDRKPDTDFIRTRLRARSIRIGRSATGIVGGSCAKQKAKMIHETPSESSTAHASSTRWLSRDDSSSRNSRSSDWRCSSAIRSSTSAASLAGDASAADACCSSEPHARRSSSTVAFIAACSASTAATLACSDDTLSCCARDETLSALTLVPIWLCHTVSQSWISDWLSSSCRILFCSTVKMLLGSLR